MKLCIILEQSILTNFEKLHVSVNQNVKLNVSYFS